MAVKTFSTGEVLTASDTNTYLNNGGLVYVASGSFTAATTFDITGFSATYFGYRILFNGRRVDTVGNATLTGHLVSGTTVRNTGYYAAAGYSSYLGAQGNKAATNNGASFYCGNFDSGLGIGTNSGLTSFDCTGMTSASFMGTGSSWDPGNAQAVYWGVTHNVSETNDKIRVTASAGTISGTWRLYGYREP
jgi:hypothetical protein